MKNHRKMVVAAGQMILLCLFLQSCTSLATAPPAVAPARTSNPTLIIPPSATPEPAETPRSQSEFAAAPLPEHALARLGKGWTSAMSMSPDGRHLAIASSIGVYLYRVMEGSSLLQQAWFYPTRQVVTGIAFSSDGHTLAAGLQGTFMGDYPCNVSRSFPALLLLDADTGEELQTQGVGNTSVELVFAPDDATLGYIQYVGGDDSAYLWNLGSEPVHIPYFQTAAAEGMSHLMFSPDGKSIAYGLTVFAEAGENWVLLRDRQNQQIVQQLGPFTATIVGFDFSPDGKRLAMADSEGRISVWELLSGREVSSFSMPAAQHVYFTPDNQQLVVIAETEVVLWNWLPNRAEWKATVHARGASFLEQGRQLATFDEAGITLWDTANGQELKKYTLDGHVGYDQPVFLPDGKRLVTASLAGDLVIWDIVTSTPVQTFHVNDQLFDFELAPDGKTMAVRQQKAVSLWDLALGKLERTYSDLPDSPGKIAFAPDGRTLALAIRQQIYLLDTFTGKLQKLREGDPGLVFSRDGKTLAFRSVDGTQIILWDVVQKQVLDTLEFNWPYGTPDLIFSPDGRWLGSVSFGADISWWSVNERRSLPPPMVNATSPLQGIAFSPDGETGAVGSLDVLLWETSTGTEVAALPGHTCWANKVLFSPDGKLLASRADDGTILLWDMAEVMAGQ